MRKGGKEERESKRKSNREGDRKESKRRRQRRVYLSIEPHPHDGFTKFVLLLHTSKHGRKKLTTLSSFQRRQSLFTCIF